MRGKIDANLNDEQLPERGSSPQMAILGSCGGTDTSRHERSQSGMTSQHLMSSSNG